MTDDLIPFGKHKGKPIEILATDKEYTEWLHAQPWFKTKYQNIYTIVINNFHTPVDTPEHNEMQIKFLDREYSLKFAYYLDPNLFQWNSERINEALKSTLNESHDRDITLKAIISDSKNVKLLSISQPIFEGGFDVSFSVKYGHRYWSYFVKTFIEIKPTIGDDYPSVLRQMKTSMPVRSNDSYSNSFYCLLVRDYIGEGASKEQFIKFFQSQNYKVVFASDVENVCLPAIEEEFQLNIS